MSTLTGPIFRGCAVTLLGLATLSAASAQSYPERPIRIIVPVQAGLSTNDSIPRAIGQRLSVALGQPVIMDNRVGASGEIGTNVAASATPDGYTLLVGYTTTMAVRPSLGIKLGYDPSKDLTPVARVFTSTSLIAISSTVPATNLTELIAQAKSKPGQYIFGSAGAGSTPHLCGELFQIVAGINFTHVPYKSAGAALTGLASGEAHVACQAGGSVTPLINAGRLRAIVIAGPQRLPSLPNVPTSKESGIPDFEVQSWSGFMAPAKTPTPIIQRLYIEIAKIMEIPDIKNFILKQGAEPALMPPEAFGAYIISERAKWGKVVKAAKLDIN